MARTRWTSMICVTVLVAVAGCSSGGGGGNQQQLAIQADVSQLMQTMAFVIGFLDPFSSAPQDAGPALAVGGCTDVSENVCDTGTVEECATAGEDVQVIFSDCSASAPDGGLVVDGVLTYSPGADWPTGQRDLIVTTPSESWFYDMTFDGTSTVQVDVEDLIDGTLADCTGDLVTAQAACTIIPPVM